MRHPCPCEFKKPTCQKKLLLAEIMPKFWEMSEGDTNLIARIRDALDDGLSQAEMEGHSTQPATDVGKVPDKYMDIDDYCKLVQETGLMDSATGDTPMDSRSLLPQLQVKLDSGQTAFSKKDFLDRLSSYDIMKWSQKPDVISAFQCARYGWKLIEWGSLACVTCKLVTPVPSQSTKFHGTDWAVRLRQSLEKNGHSATCPWTRVPSPMDILSIPKGPDLHSYILDAGASYNRMQTLPTLQDPYTLIMKKLNLKLIRDIIGLEVPATEDCHVSADTSSIPKMYQDMALFLILNGWTMKEASTDDVIKCFLCLRQVPLWICKSPAVENEILELLSQPPSPVKNKSITKELEPVTNHWEWCPWRKALQCVSSPVSSESDNGETILNSSNPERPKKTVDICNYERLLEYIQEECANSKLNYCKEKSGVHLIDSVSAMLSNFVSSPPSQTLTGKHNGSPTTVSPMDDGDDDARQESEISLENNNKRRNTEEAESESSRKRICRNMFVDTLNELNN